MEDNSAEKEREEFKNRLNFLLSNPYRELYLAPHNVQTISFGGQTDLEAKHSEQLIKSDDLNMASINVNEWAAQTQEITSQPLQFSNKLDFVLMHSTPPAAAASSFPTKVGHSTSTAKSPEQKIPSSPLPSSPSSTIPAAIPTSLAAVAELEPRTVLSVDDVRYLEHGVILVKPHAVNDDVLTVIETLLTDHSIRIQYIGHLSGADLSARNVVQHSFCTLFQHAIVIDPLELHVTAEMISLFRTHFLMEWTTALNQSQLTNACDAAAYLEITQAELYDMCRRSKFPTLRLCKGVHLTYLDEDCSSDPAVKSLLKSPIYVVNGFYSALKAQYENPATEVAYLLIEWDGAQWTWADLVHRIVGDSDPALASPTSIRGTIYRHWESLNLPAAPSRVDNCVHASASAFEGMVDRVVWTPGATLQTDILGSRLLAARIPHHLCQKWMRNPLVDGRTMFDHMLYLNARASLHQAKLLQGITTTCRLIVCKKETPTDISINSGKSKKFKS